MSWSTETRKLFAQCIWDSQKLDFVARIQTLEEKKEGLDLNASSHWASFFPLGSKDPHSFPPTLTVTVTHASSYSPGSIFRPPFTMAISSLFLVSSPSEASRPNSLLKKPSSSSSASLLSSQTHSSQHCPGTLTSLGLGQPRLGRESSCGQSGMQPTAPSMHVHWCLQFGWKLSPFW